MSAAPPTKREVKRRALYRDDYRCTMTGAYDFESTLQHGELREAMAKMQPKPQCTTTQCAHIFSESAQDKDKVLYASSVLAILKMFGHESLIDKIVGGHVNDLLNVMTMSQSLHSLYDLLTFWLEPVHDQSLQENTYNVKTLVDEFFSLTDAPPRQITFQISPKIQEECAALKVPLPELPSRTLLSIRAACSRVANLSGGAEQIEQMMRDLEETTVLSEDGSTAELLTSRLLSVAA
ncbi:hypothetical protein C8J56DRAFT_892567 [Mycena floridula]|nr:hypothetical protein C8J56DRAFT_892567 [Mycena floridula]